MQPNLGPGRFEIHPSRALAIGPDSPRKDTYMSEQRERGETLAPPTTKVRDESWEQLTIERLDDLLAKWNATGTMPVEADVLSGGEYRALVFAAGRERDLHAPVRDFLLLDAWLQRWVLETWGRPSLVGVRIGVNS